MIINGKSFLPEGFGSFAKETSCIAIDARKHYKSLSLEDKLLLANDKIATAQVKLQCNLLAISKRMVEDE